MLVFATSPNRRHMSSRWWAPTMAPRGGPSKCVPPHSRGHVQQLAIAAKSAARHASALTFRALETRAFDSVRAGAMVMA